MGTEMAGHRMEGWKQYLSPEKAREQGPQYSDELRAKRLLLDSKSIEELAAEQAQEELKRRRAAGGGGGGGRASTPGTLTRQDGGRALLEGSADEQAMYKGIAAVAGEPVARTLTAGLKTVEALNSAGVDEGRGDGGDGGGGGSGGGADGGGGVAALANDEELELIEAGMAAAQAAQAAAMEAWEEEQRLLQKVKEAEAIASFVSADGGSKLEGRMMSPGGNAAE